MTAKKKTKAWILIPLLLILLAGGTFVFYKQSLKPVQTEAETVIFTVPKGVRSKDVCFKLEEEGLIRNSLAAYLHIRQLKLTDVCAGDFELDKSWDVEKIFTVLCDPKSPLSDQVLVTIPEGKWAEETAEILSAALEISREELLECWNDADYVRALGGEFSFISDDMFKPGIRYLLEGYLFPDSYYFHPDASADTITRKILSRTEEIYRKFKEEIDKNPLSTHEVFTLASIVQYESGNPRDNAGIAGVFFNRLNHPEHETAGYLQSNVTATYGWGSKDVNTEQDENKFVESPYNTYVIQGLPIGPVCNPGENAIRAVLHPESHDYYYFLSDKEGNIHYARTFQEHLINDQTY
jgi:UPF0755 protein